MILNLVYLLTSHQSLHLFEEQTHMVPVGAGIQFNAIKDIAKLLTQKVMELLTTKQIATVNVHEIGG